jgi:hypothetical protein
MSRVPKAAFSGIAFIIVYIILVVAIPVHFGRMYWVLELIYWAVAGVIWVFPIRWLMLWSVHKR